MQRLSGLDPLFLGYVVVFGLAALACFGGLARTSDVDDPDTRRGLQWLLLLSGVWAASHVVFLVVPATAFKLAAYYAGLTVGFAAVGAWLYFCSAYTGRSLHRMPSFRRLAVAVFLLVLAVKYTNPIHGLYFTATPSTTPFPHLAVEHHLLHWLAMGLAYAVSTVGYFMLLERFVQTGYDTRPLVVLVGLTGLPVVFDVAGAQVPVLLDLTYEPLGVAVFAVGTLFLFYQEFQAVQLAGGVDDPVVFLDADGRVRDTNRSAERLFPQLEGAVGEPFADVAPRLADALDSDDRIVQLDHGDETRYYMLSSNPFSSGDTKVGTLVLITDVTRTEQYRREIERQNERLERFASVVSHDLRNPLNVAIGRIDLERQQRDSENLEAATRALDRMTGLVEDVLTLAREGQDIGETEPVSLATVVARAWESVDAPGADVRVATDGVFQADATRLQQALENLFRNSVEHGSTGSQDGKSRPDDSVEHGSTSTQRATHSDNVDAPGADVVVTVGWLDGDPDADATGDAPGFYVEDDGPGIPPAARDEVFASGHSGTPGGSGLGLAIVQSIAEAHGWSIELTESEAGGARFEFRGVELGCVSTA